MTSDEWNKNRRGYETKDELAMDAFNAGRDSVKAELLTKIDHIKGYGSAAIVCLRCGTTKDVVYGATEPYLAIGEMTSFVNYHKRCVDADSLDEVSNCATPSPRDSVVSSAPMPHDKVGAAMLAWEEAEKAFVTTCIFGEWPWRRKGK